MGELPLYLNDTNVGLFSTRLKSPRTRTRRRRRTRTRTASGPPGGRKRKTTMTLSFVS